MYDDIGTSAPALIRAQIPYNNNGQTSPNLKTYPQEGWTNISPDGKQVVSTSYTGTHKLITDIIRGGRQYVSDINAEYSGNVLSICYDCTPTHPAHLVSGGKSWTYPAPMTASFATTTGGVWFFWVDPADGSFHGAPKTGYSISACTGPISCDAPISDWPSGAIRISKLSTISPCPGSFGGTNGSEDYHCRGYQDAHGVYLGEGYAVTSGDILVTHQITPVANTPDPATEITSISPDFVGVQIGGVNPKVAVFGKGTDTATFNESAFTTTHAGTAQYLVSGLNPGIYDIARDGVTIRSGISVSGSDGAVYFESVKGRFSIFQSGTLPGLVVSTSSLPDAVVQQAYSQALAASGGAPPYTWSIDSGSLPAGLSLGIGGSITGVPPTSGTSSFVARVTDSTSTHATRSITLNVVPSNTVHITTTGLPRATNGVAYDASLSAISGTPPYRWTLTGGALPTGLSMTQGGTIQGQPAAAGSWSFTVKVTDALETTDFHAYTLVVDAATVPLRITSPATLPMIMLGDSYEFTLEAIGGTAPYSWTITGGSLPPGIALTSTTAGTLAGTPTAVGAYSFTAQVTDSQSGSASQQFALVVSGTEPLVLDSQSMPRGFVGQNYSFTLSASGGTPPYSWSITGSLPAGLTLDPSSGAITGVPQTVADSPIEVTVTDAGGTTAEANFVSSMLRFIAANNIEVSPLTRQALIKYGFTGLPAEVACSLEAKSTDASGPVVSSTVDHGGPSRRIAVLSDLDPAAIHSVELRCQDFGGRKAFRTRGSDPRISVAVGAADLKVQMVAPPGLAATQLLLEYGADPVTFGSTVTTPCAGRCVATINVSPDSIVYLQPKWLDAQGQILTVGSVKIVAVP